MKLIDDIKHAYHQKRIVNGIKFFVKLQKREGCLMCEQQPTCPDFGPYFEVFSDIIKTFNPSFIDLYRNMSESDNVKIIGIVGKSMNPILCDSDLCIAFPIESAHLIGWNVIVGDIIAYHWHRIDDYGTTRIPNRKHDTIHRIIAKTDKGFRLKGDDNDGPDELDDNVAEILSQDITHLIIGRIRDNKVEYFDQNRTIEHYLAYLDEKDGIIDG